MTRDRGIVWLASYPKSGNTWFRIFLTHILNAANQELNLNKQTIVGTGSSARFVMDRVLGFDSRLLSEDELEPLKPAIYDWHAKQPGIKYFKIHDAYCTLSNKMPIILRESSVGIIYFIRNPLDVVISFAHHMNCSINDAIIMMNNPFLALKGSAAKPMSQVRQICSSWSLNVKSWTSVCDINLLTLRYEDMHSAPLATFSKAIKFLQLQVSEEIILNALENSQFRKLKQDEQKHGFRESASPARFFFRKGIAGDWENTLTESQIKLIVSHHGSMMRYFGYLDEHNHPVSCRGASKVKEIDNESIDS
jgi:hypothetical protein